MPRTMTSETGNDSSSVADLMFDFGPCEEDLRWRKMPELVKFVGAPRSKHTVVAFENSVYVFGGDDGKSMLNDLLRFDVKEKSWCRCRSTGVLPASRYHHSAVVHQASMFVFGGYTGDIHSNSNLTNRNDLWEYKFDTTQWVEWRPPPGSSPQPVPRSAHGAAVYDGMLYIFAGYDGNARLKDMWRITLSPSSKSDNPTGGASWEQVECAGESPPTCCNFPVAVSRDSMFVFSGQTGARVTNALFQFHFTSQTWTRISIEHILRDCSNPPTRRYGHSMVNFGNHLYIFGGAADNILPNELHRFDLDDDTWSIVVPAPQSSLPSGRLFHAATIVGDAMFLFGGTVDNNIRSGEMFRLQLSSFPKCTLKNDLGKLLKPSLSFTTDLTFEVGTEGAIIHAHAAIISARCEWLKEKVMAVKNNQETDSKVVKLPEADPSAFRLILEYIYTDQIDPTKGCAERATSQDVVHDIMRVYTLALSFGMSRLEKLCVRYLESSVNLSNVLVTLKNSSSLNLHPIKEFCLRYIIKESNYNAIVMSAEFETLEQTLMVEIIRRRQHVSNQSKDGAEPAALSKPTSVFGLAAVDGCGQSCSLKEDLQKFLASPTLEEFADVELVLDGSTFYAHKAILAARSQYFEAMFRSFSPESNKVAISIGDVVPSHQSFESLIRYIYYGDVIMPPEDSLYLFTAHAFYIFSNNRLQVEMSTGNWYPNY